MASPSKEQQLLRLILENSPTKHWHFEEIVKKAKLTRAVANKWLKKYSKEGLLKRIKEKGKFPYFTAGSNNPAYQSKKKLYALEELYQSGLIPHLNTINAKTIIVFGSMIKGDWYKESDIDIFIYGEPKGIDKQKYEKKLKRSIELHVFETKKDIKAVRTGIINNIINGYLVKGQLQDFAEVG
ncbi:MAG: nucleotidyltransferase domain-containing protein [Nanoarchaeota archaeon]|nr:nucleotidyltransferase domain-containing protein [Nanoarchaeota archaeon]